MPEIHVALFYEARLGPEVEEALMLRALISADRPVVRIWSPDDPSRYVELRFEFSGGR